MDALVEELREWSDSAFGTGRGPRDVLRKLSEEIREAYDDPTDLSEWADCFMTLADAFAKAGFTFSEVLAASREKLGINRKRTWELREDGCFHHVLTEERDGD